MERIKTLLTYALLIIVFFIFSVVMENGFVHTMYKNISGEFEGKYKTEQLSTKDTLVKASNLTGNMSFKLINTTHNFIDKCYLKIELFNKQNLLADTKYIEIYDLEPGESKNINIKFKANNIKKYKITVEKNIPDKTNIINILGWEIDLTNVFGLGIDLSDATIFGVKLTDIFLVSNAKKAGSNIWKSIKFHLAKLPWWSYVIGGGIVIWNLPAFYLFGIL